jgi:hypothetical protein
MRCEAAERVMAFDTFTADNDPYGEHDFGSLDYEGQRIFWKIDYYDRASFGTGCEMSSDDPTDPAKTARTNGTRIFVALADRSGTRWRNWGSRHNEHTRAVA